MPEPYDPATAEVLSRIAVCQPEIDTRGQRYITHSDFPRFQEKLNSCCNNPPCFRKKHGNHDAVTAFRGSFPKAGQQIDTWNEDFIQREMEKGSSWFSWFFVFGTAPILGTAGALRILCATS